MDIYGDIIEYELEQIKRITPKITHGELEVILRRSVQSAYERGEINGMMIGDDSIIPIWNDEK